MSGSNNWNSLDWEEEEYLPHEEQSEGPIYSEFFMILIQVMDGTGILRIMSLHDNRETRAHEFPPNVTLKDHGWLPLDTFKSILLSNKKDLWYMKMSCKGVIHRVNWAIKSRTSYDHILLSLTVMNINTK